MVDWKRTCRHSCGRPCLMNFHNFFSIYVFEVKESIADIPTELPCSGDLENPGQNLIPMSVNSPSVPSVIVNKQTIN